MQLQDKEIIDLLLDYVKDKRYKQAILIDGEWGTGKTYFVKEKLLNKIKEELPECSVFYISLYGLESTEQILTEMYSETVGGILEKSLGKEKGEKVEKGLSIAAKLFGAGMKAFNIETKELPSWEDIKEIKDAVIIFDDLERCELEINKSLGFINNLVEHNNIKVILVANQKEIGGMNIPKELPQKYLLALDARLEIDEPTQINEKKKEGEKFTKEELANRTDKIFSEDLLYEKIKEKLIGLTIYYQPDINNIFKPIVEGYISLENVQGYLLENKQIIVNMFMEKKHYNIRTLIFGIMAFEKFYVVLDRLAFEPRTYKDEQIKSVLKYTMALSIQIKSGKPVYSWADSSSEAGIVYFEKILLGQGLFGYKFVDDYLLYRYLDEKEIGKTMIEIMEEKKSINMSRNAEKALSINKLSSWWKLEDEEVEGVLMQLKRELSEKNIRQHTLKI